jgi:phage terminase large subunit-like protein
MEAYVKELSNSYHVVEVRYDPFQFHRSATTLSQAGVKMIEFPQTVGNMTEAGQALYDAVKHRTLKLYGDDQLREEARFAVGKETPRGMRIVKEKASHKIDAIVALAMAVLGVSSSGEKIAGTRVSLGITVDSFGERPADVEKMELPGEFGWVKKY